MIIIIFIMSSQSPTAPPLLTHLGSRFFLTRVTKVSISAAVMCFSSSLRLLCSRAVIVSSASTSYPICFCMKRNCLAMYSCEEKDRRNHRYKVAKVKRVKSRFPPHPPAWFFL